MELRTADEIPSVDWISTTLPALDKILGGGIPTRRITEISGAWSVGKSTLALTIIANAQKEGYKTLWCDQEWSWERGYAIALGVDVKKLSFIQEKMAEDALDMLEEYADKNKNVVMVIDAIGALQPRKDAEKQNDGKNIASQAGLVSKFCRKIVPILSLNNSTLIVLNHEFLDFMSSMPKVLTSGGKKLEYHKSIWLRLKKMPKRVMQGENQIGDIIEAEVRKNKLAPTLKQSCELTLIYGNGFYKEANILDEALEKGIILRKGNTFTFNGEKIGVGQTKLREAMKDAILLEKINAALLNALP